MGLKYLLCAVLILLLMQCWCGGGCLEQERTALLQLKVFFNGRPLRNWGIGDHNSDCCQWERVECNPSTGRVIALYLNSTRAGLYNSRPYWYLNTSLFLPFEELKGLYLPKNRIAGCIENEGFNRLSEKLSNLEILDLSDNFFNNNILLSVNELSSLKFLNLGWNNINASNHINGFYGLPRKLRNLEILDLSGGFFNNSILSFFSELSSLKSLTLANNNFKISNKMDAIDFAKLSRLHNLEFLDISRNDLQNNSLSYLGNLSSLKTLIISECGLKGTVTTQGLSKLINLKRLDMSWNKIESLKSSQEEQQNLRFVHLEVLDLSENLFNNNVLSFVNKFSNLKSLYLANNKIKGLVNVTEFNALSNLEELDMSDNMLNQFVATTEANISFNKLKSLHLGGYYYDYEDDYYQYEKSHVQLQQLSLVAFPSLKTLSLFENNINKTMFNQSLHVLSNLEELFIYGTPLDNNFLQSIGVFTSLKSIFLRECGLIGALPNQGWCDLKNLKELILRSNELSGILPSCLGNLTSLQLLDISQNQFTGNIASSPLTHLTLLRYLSISNNNFQVPDSFKSFANHSNLKVFLSDFNQLVSEQDHVQTSVFKFQPSIFSLSNCGAKEERLIKPPSFLYNQYDLKLVDLSFNKFGGALPYWLFENNTRLQVFLVKNNSFMGLFLLPSHPSLDVLAIDISNNQIHGQIPSNINLIFPFVEKLLLSENAFKGKIPMWLGGMNSLQILDLSNNQFSGSIPNQLAMGNSLYDLRLSNNNLSGKIATAIFNSQSLQNLYLDGNNFEVEKSWLSISSFLEVLDISNNHLSGKLPRWIRNLTQLEELVLSNNYFKGSIPEEFCHNDALQFLDLSKNNLSGSLPSCPNPSHITHLYLSKNRLSGPLTHSFYNISSLVVLDLRENNFSGGIPKWIGNFSMLSILLLRSNHFFGEIPNEVCKLEQLSMMDLSHNQLSGSVPSCLSHLTLKPSPSVYFFKSYLSIIITLSELQDQLFKNLAMTIVMEEELSEVAIAFTFRISYVKDEVEFTTKRSSYTYEGNILNYMSGIDLSYNKFTGSIPPEMGNLSEIRSLNLSYNNLTGPIPPTFSKLKQIESLDLSFNNLNGKIPSQLIELSSLAVFSVAHNNLSGTIPYGKAQFGTFDKSSYEGNPCLCGPPLNKSCEEIDSQLEVLDSLNEEKECNSIDLDIFHISFMITYVIVLLSVIAVLYINPYWRQAWFSLVERCVTNCYYVIVDNLSRF